MSTFYAFYIIFLTIFAGVGLNVALNFLSNQLSKLPAKLRYSLRKFLGLESKCIGTLTVGLHCDSSAFMREIKEAKEAAEELKQLQTKVINDAYAISTYGEEVTCMNTPNGQREFILGIRPQAKKKASRRAKARN